MFQINSGETTREQQTIEQDGKCITMGQLNTTNFECITIVQ